jgi:hypothetical protein
MRPSPLLGAAALGAVLLASGCTAEARAAGFGHERARQITFGGGAGFALDERALSEDEKGREIDGPTLLGLGLWLDYYFEDWLAGALRGKTAVDVAENEEFIAFHTLSASVKFQGDIGSLKPYGTLGGGWILRQQQRGEGDTSLRNHWMFEWGAGVDVYFLEDWATAVDFSMDHSNTEVFGREDTYMFEVLFGLKVKF